MKKPRLLPLVFAITVMADCAAAEPPRAFNAKIAVQTPVNVIFDTDMMSDTDDALALAMLHSLQERQEAKLVAVTVSTEDRWCASYVDLVDTFYGHSDIPVGLVHGGVNLRKTNPEMIPDEINYTQLLTERRNSDGTPVFPHRLVDGNQAPEAVALLRRTLASQPDLSVVMIQVGFCTNYGRLLDSQPDATSPLNGRDLIRKKVRLLSVMAGNFGEIREAGRVFARGRPEFNLMMDVPSAQKLFSGWPTPIVCSGFEVGAQLRFPAFAIDHYFSYVKDHPIAEAYRAYIAWKKLAWPHDHASFDLTSVLYAIRPGGEYFLLSKPGTITVLPGGASRFDESDLGQHRYLILPEDKKARVLEAMAMLASEPPRRVASAAE